MDASPFAPWANFYVIVGGAAAALTGLQFVVIVLGAELSAGASEHTASVFGTPNVVHFTRGGPWFAEWQNVDYGDLWLKERDALARASSSAA